MSSRNNKATLARQKGRSPEKVAARRAFAVEELARQDADGVVQHTDTSQQRWKEAAARAKTIGLYSPSTYVADAAVGLEGYAKVWSRPRPDQDTQPSKLKLSGTAWGVLHENGWMETVCNHEQAKSACRTPHERLIRVLWQEIPA